MRVVLTGATGFLGWHVRLRLHAQAQHEIVPVTRSDWARLPEIMADGDIVLHLAGVNKATSDQHVLNGNVALAVELAAALPDSCTRIVYANSSQAGNGTPYGTGKEEAAHVLTQAAEKRGADFVDVHLPNIFGEHGKPQYNSFVATFVDAKIRDATPLIQDRQMPLLHAQDAAQTLIDGLTMGTACVHPPTEGHGVREVWDLLEEFRQSYDRGEIPALTTSFRVNLFNTYRAALFPKRAPIYLTPHTDARGTFVETIRCRGGEGQSSISTTAPGVTRGEHYHLRKIERFAVLQGHANISLRKMFTDKIMTFGVHGGEPSAIDMPTGWAHNITNTGTSTLVTQFWSHELFDPQHPDTYPEPVGKTGERKQKS